MRAVWGLLESALLVGLLYAPVAVGLGFSFRVVNFPDLTCEGSFLIGSATSAVLVQAGVSPALAVIAGVFAGCIAGSVTGLLHVLCGVSPLLSGFVTTAICYSASIRILQARSNLRITEGTLYDRLNPANVGLIDLGVTAVAILVMFAVLGVAYRTRMVRLIRAFGDTPWFCVTIGKNPKLCLVQGLAISNGIIGFGGAIVTHYKRICDVNMSFGVLLGGLAALVLGETVYAARGLLAHASICAFGSVLYNVALGIFYFGRWGEVLIPSDVRIVTGVLLILPSLIAGRLLPRYRLFSSEW